MDGFYELEMNTNITFRICMHKNDAEERVFIVPAFIFLLSLFAKFAKSRHQSRISSWLKKGREQNFYGTGNFYGTQTAFTVAVILSKISQCLVNKKTFLAFVSFYSENALFHCTLAFQHIYLPEAPFTVLIAPKYTLS